METVTVGVLAVVLTIAFFAFQWLFVHMPNIYSVDGSRGVVMVVMITLAIFTFIGLLAFIAIQVADELRLERDRKERQLKQDKESKES